jgi:hypothetical protein
MFQIQSNLPHSWGHLYQGSLRQFVWTKISFSRLLVCNLHWCRLVRILAREKIRYISIWNHVIPRGSRIPVVGNIVSCLFHHYNRQFVSFTSTWNRRNNKSSWLTHSHIGSLPQLSISPMSKLHSTSVFIWLDYELFGAPNIWCECP